MKSQKLKYIIMIASFMLFIGMISLLVFMGDIDRQTDETSTTYTATVTGVEITNTGKDDIVEIFTKEYDNTLHISTNISDNINLNDIKDLEHGQIIWFRIENTMAQNLNKAAFVDIISLKTDEKIIFSLDEYNQYMRISAYPARIAGIVFSLLFLSISVFCFYKIKRNRTRNSD